MKRISMTLCLALLIAVSIFPLADLMHPGLPITHDGQDHVARIANFYQSLSEGHIVPRWAGNLNWGYGHPILMFLYPMSSYIGSVFHAFGLSFVDSTKLVFAMAYIASIVAMFVWLKAQWGTKAGLTGAILYGFAPYRFVDLYVRGAIGEHVAFIFIPLVMYALLMLAKQKSDSRYVHSMVLSLSMAGLLLSHNAVSLMSLPVILLYGFYVYIFVTRKSLPYLFITLSSVVLGFMVSAFFWVPAFFEGKYTLRDIVTKGEFTDRFVPWTWFFKSAWNYGGGNQFTKEIGISGWFAIIGSLFVMIFEKNKRARWILGASLLCFGMTLFLMTQSSHVIWQNISILQKFQFPWRLLTLSVFFTAVMGSYLVSRVLQKFQWVVMMCLIVVAIVSTIPMWKARDYVDRPDTFYSGIYNGTTDTGESSPIWSVRFMETRSKEFMEIIEGDAIITAKARSSTSHEYDIISTKKTRLVENTLYFPGWIVYVDDKITPVEFQDERFRGLITFFIDAGTHHVNIRFTDTRLRYVSNGISVIGLLVLILLPGLHIWKKRK